MINIKKFTFNSFYENTFVVWSEGFNDCAIIDPGCYEDFEEEELTKFLEKMNLIPKYLINTHCHIDHILGCKFVKDKFDPIFLIPEEDLPLLSNAKQQASIFGMQIKVPPKPDGYLSEEDTISIGNSELKFIFTPGHTPGEYCIYFEREKKCITGDVLFNQSIGRTDLWGGDYKKLLDSIRNKILVLPDDVDIFPGHGENSTIGFEKKNNPFLI